MKAIGYIRVSTQDQAEEGISLEAQRAKIEAWCLVNDYSLVDVFVDAGISGKAMGNREGLQVALDAVNKGVALVAYSMSRLSRSTKDMLVIEETLAKTGADLVSLTEKIDTTSAAGKMVFKMLAVLNGFERDLVSERTRAALAHKKAKGERVGTIPYGYCLGADGRTLETNQEEREILDTIKQLKDAGYKLREITEQLNQDGLLTRRGSQWRVQYIHNLLKAA